MNIEEELQDIASKIHSEESQLRLQRLLTERVPLSELHSTKTQQLLQSISSDLTKSLLESKIYHMINEAKYATEQEGNFSIGKCILDPKGYFIWVDKATEKMFGIPSQSLENYSLFSLMSPCSIRYLYSKYSSELLLKQRKIIISYVLSDGKELTSRCTLVNYSAMPGCYKKGIYLETRVARHKVLNFSNSLNISPLMEYSENGMLFTPIQITPSAFSNNEISAIDLENLRITPFLRGDSPYKKRKIDECTISEFN